jgi:hypothetical protein
MLAAIASLSSVVGGTEGERSFGVIVLAFVVVMLVATRRRRTE